MTRLSVVLPNNRV